MKKIILCTLLVLVLIVSTCFAFADELDEPVTDPDVTDYVEASIVRSHLNIKDGYTVCKTRVDVENSSTANKMVVTVLNENQSAFEVDKDNMIIKSDTEGLSFDWLKKYCNKGSK